jgi:hypothetical protein
MNLASENGIEFPDGIRLLSVKFNFPKPEEGIIQAPLKGL